MRITFLLFCSMLLSWVAQGQTKSVQGMLKDDKIRVVAGASVKLISDQDSLVTSSSIAGIFIFNNVKAGKFKISVSNLGFERFEQEFTYPEGESKYIIPSFTLKPASELLEEVVIDGVPTIVVKGDTLEYTMKDLKLRDGSVAEDALKKLQGVEVDKDGNVTAQGESVKRVRINGKDFFGGDVKTATQNLPASIIEKMQIVDDYGDMANITGNKNGDSEKVLNIQIDPKYNKGQMATLRAGYGTEDRYQATGMWTGMKEGAMLSILGNMNNINAPLFDFSATGGGARRQQGGGGRRGSFGGNTTGLTNTGSIGANFRRDFNDKLTVYGSYSFGRDDNNTTSQTVNEYILKSGNQIDKINSNSNTITGSHRFESNIEWKPSVNDFIKITPQIGYDKRDVNSSSQSSTYFGDVFNYSEDERINSTSTAPRFGISGLYNRKLNEKGRNIFFNMNLNSSATKKDQENILERLTANETDPTASMDSLYQQAIQEANNKSWNGGASVNYTEPVSEYGKIEITYDFNRNTYDNKNSQSAFDEFGELILNKPKLNFDYDYDYSFTTHRMGANYSFNNDKVKYSIGAAVQPSQLRGDAYSSALHEPIHRNAFNIMPIARFEYKFSRQSNLSINYSGSSTEPTVSQILPFDISTYETSSIIGNADLVPQFTHQMNMRFRNGDFQKGKSFFAMLNANLTNDKIVTFRKRFLRQGIGMIQETYYLNATEDPTYGFNSFYHYGKSLKEKTYNLMLMGGISYNKNISYISEDSLALFGDKNVSSNWVFNQGLMFRYNPSEKLEINPGIRYRYDYTHNSLTNIKTSVSSWTPTLIGSVNITPSLIYGVDISKTFNNGFAVNSNPFIINTYVEQKFLKDNRATLRLQAFDLLNQQTNITRTLNESLIADSRTNRLARYFMLTLTYKFEKFALGSPTGDGGGHGGMRPPRM